ncbi:MAG: spermidine/putrescine transport system permease protein [Chloroflexota bacterium]|nr:spermidine/putrescine transport system permease protein [Chloroflexota bacterium]
MSTEVATAVKSAALRPRARTSPNWWRRLGSLVLPSYTHLVMLWLFAPIIVMVIYGFNDTHGRLNIVWSGFTLKWFRDPFGVTALTTAVYTSLITATIGAFLSTVLGTMIALASHRYSFRGKALLDAVMVMNIAASEVVMGAALVTLFVASSVPLGVLTIVLAQVMFSIPFVAITVRARLVGFDSSLEEAAQDLGASPLTTFRLVTLPIIFPGVLAAALLAFALCLDDYVITSFVSGNTQTFPLWVYGATRLGVPPQVNVIGTFIFIAGGLMAISFATVRSWRNRRLARESAL